MHTCFAVGEIVPETQSYLTLLKLSLYVGIKEFKLGGVGDVTQLL